jgi:hypothetical protein
MCTIVSGCGDTAVWMLRTNIYNIYIYTIYNIQGVSGEIENIFGGGSMDYSE